jgi:galactoside O-acetyltransferase
MISDKAVFYHPERIHIGDNVRIDDFCILSAGIGGIEIGSFIHIACYAYMVGAAKITLKDYSSFSGRCAIYSSTDDFSGAHLINPMVPSEYLGVRSAPVTLEKHAVVGTGATLMIGVTVGEGAAVGAMSFVKKSIPAFEIWAGQPAVKVADRKRGLLDLEKAHQLSLRRENDLSPHDRFVEAIREYP